MIVKIPEKRRDSKSSFKALSKYITADLDRSNIDITRAGFDLLTQYITRETIPDILANIEVEKTIAVEIGNLNSLATAATEMYSVAHKNNRSDDPVYHYILSWPAHERPEARDMISAARDTITALGLADHQYIIAIHANTDNLHAHIEVNRIHPVTFKPHHIEWAQKALHHAAREAEIKYGWSHDNGIYNVIEINGKKIIVERGDMPEPPKNDHLIEVWNREESLETWCKRLPAPQLKELLPTLQSWDDLHDTLHQYGLQLIDSGGGGMKIATIPTNDTEKPITVSASKAFRFLKRPELEARFGKFIKPTIHTPTTNEGEENEQPDEIGSDHPDNHPDTAQSAKYQQRATTLNLIRNPGTPLSKSGAATTRRNRQTVTGSLLHHLSDIPLVQDIERDEMLLPPDAHPHLDDLETQGDLDLRRPLPRRDGGRKQITPPQTTYQRDPDKRLAAKLERSETRRALLDRYNKEKAIHKTTRAAMLKEVADRKAARIDAINTDRKKQRLSVLKDPSLTPQQKQQAHSIIAAQTAARKEIAETRSATERKQLSEAFKTLPISSYRLWVEDLSKQGDEAAIAALRGIIYQEGRDRKKKKTEDELEQEASKKKATLIAPEGGTHDPKKAIGLDWHLHAGSLYFTNKDSGDLIFADNGDNISWERAQVDDEALRLSLRHAAEKWGRKLSVSGGDETFQQRLALAAKNLGLEIINVEIQNFATSTPAPTTKEITPTATQATANDITSTQKIANTIPKATGGEGGGAGVPDMTDAMTDIDKFISDIRNRHPEATITIHNPTDTKPQRGTIIESDPNYIAQQTEKDHYTIHPRTAFKQTAGEGRNVTIRYDNKGKAKMTPIDRDHDI